MPITYKQKVAVLDGNCEADLAGELDAWLAENPKRQLNLKSLTHAHTAIYQVMIKHGISVSVWPADDQDWHWLKVAIDSKLYDEETNP